MPLLFGSQCLHVLAPTPRGSRIIPVWSHSVPLFTAVCFIYHPARRTPPPPPPPYHQHHHRWFQLRSCLPSEQVLICLVPVCCPAPLIMPPTWQGGVATSLIPSTLRLEMWPPLSRSTAAVLPNQSHWTCHFSAQQIEPGPDSQLCSMNIQHSGG